MCPPADEIVSSRSPNRMMDPTHAVNMRCHSSGAVLIILMLIATLAGSSLLLAHLHRVLPGRQYDGARTARSLAAAKQALIGYAITYPDHFSGQGPGFLPCPDSNNNGSPNPPCGQSAIGRLPWRYLGIDDLRDGAGERLWYALAQNFRNNPKIAVLNSDTPAQLCIDGNHDTDCSDATDATDLVAILFAPGFAVQFQDRSVDLNAVEHYLEDDNATPSDHRYRRASAAEIANTDATADTFNDRLLTLSRTELMAAIERRVSAQVQRTLQTYADTYGADTDHDGDGDTYLWLAPFENPSASPYRSAVGYHHGQLPHHHPLQSEFPTDFTVTLQLDGIIFPSVPTGTVETGDFTNTVVFFAAADDSKCLWNNAKTVDCTAQATRIVDGSDGPAYPATWRQRHWELQHLVVSGTPAFTNPSADDVRRRHVNVNLSNSEGATEGATLVMSITDTGYARNCSACSATSLHSGSGEMALSPSTTGTIDVRDLHFDLDVPEELPEWFINNRWHHLVYIATATEHAPGGSGQCTPASSCLSLSGRLNTATNAIEVLVITAGPTLDSQSRPSNQLNDYYENDNHDADSDYEHHKISTVFNDSVVIIAP